MISVASCNSAKLARVNGKLTTDFLFQLQIVLVYWDDL